MRILFWIVILPLVAVVVVFALFNRDPITLDFWPYPLLLQVPVYLTVLGAVFVGFLLGSAVTWVSQGRWRKRARDRARRIAHLEREISGLGAGPATPGPKPPAPPQGAREGQREGGPEGAREGQREGAGAPAPLLPLRESGAGRAQERGEAG